MRSSSQTSAIQHEPLSSVERPSSTRAQGGRVAAVREKFAALERAASPPTSAPPPNSADRRIRRKSVPVVPRSSPTASPAPLRTSQPQRHSMAIGPGGANTATDCSTPTLVRPLNTAQQSFLRHSLSTPTEPLDLEPLRDSRHAKERFERVDAKDDGRLRRRGAVGRLRALIERFERW